MSAVNEWIVREYFESLGFLVLQPRKHMSPGRQKTPEEEVDLLVVNPRVREVRIPDHLVWQTGDLKGIARAIVGVRGWHTERFYASRVDQTPEILRFAEKESLHYAEKLLGSEPIVKILCVPKLAVSGELREKTVKSLREKGLHGVISFETMLLELIARVETHRNYGKSDLLQVIRILKAYGLLRDSQMDLFPRAVVRKQPAAAKKEKGETGEPKPA